MASPITSLTPIDPFPTRELPQDRFDAAVRTNMSQLSTMVTQLNTFVTSYNSNVPSITFINDNSSIITSVPTYATQAKNAASRAEIAAENAEAVAGIGIATTSVAGISKPDGEEVTIAQNGTLGLDFTNAVVGFDNSFPVYDRGMNVYRSANGIACTVEYEGWDGTQRKFEILDCAYCPTGTYQFGTYGTNSGNPDFSGTGTSGNNYLTATGSLADYATTDLPPSENFSGFKANWGSKFTTDLTAKNLCATWMTYRDSYDSYTTPTLGVPAVQACTSITVDGGGWVLPNEWELAICFIVADLRDKIDPTAISYPLCKIGKTHENGRFRGNHFFSATENTSNREWVCAGTGYIATAYKYRSYCVLPIREIQ